MHADLLINSKFACIQHDGQVIIWYSVTNRFDTAKLHTNESEISLWYYFNIVNWLPFKMHNNESHWINANNNQKCVKWSMALKLNLCRVHGLMRVRWIRYSSIFSMLMKNKKLAIVLINQYNWCVDTISAFGFHSSAA